MLLEALEERCVLSGGYTRIDLASDVPGLARVTDPNLVNPWGISASPTGPFWFAENGTGVSDVLDGRGEPFSLVVSVPPGAAAAAPGGEPTGTVFNAGTGFAISWDGVTAPARFLFAGEDGTISGWTSVVDPTLAFLAVDNSASGAAYTGLALATDPAGRDFLYAADFGRGAVDVYDSQFRPASRPGAFRDPDLPRGFAPFNVQNLGGQLYVTYARRDEYGDEYVTGPGRGFVDVYDTAGDLVRRFASRGALDAPWGLALAPGDFGEFGGAVLVGNTGDGRVNAFDPASGEFLGALADGDGTPIQVPNLWGLASGNGHEGGDPDTLFFTAGVGDEEHGLFGAVQPPDRADADTAGSGSFDLHAPGEPGDYPLPPRDGPALRNRDDGPPRPTPVLLPLPSSPLVLAPTLTVDPRTGGRNGGPEGAPPVAGAPSGVAERSVPAGPVRPLPPASGGALAPPGNRRAGPPGLDDFTDLGTRQVERGIPAGGGRQDAPESGRSVGAPRPPRRSAEGGDRPDAHTDPARAGARVEAGADGPRRWRELAGGILVALGLPVIRTLSRPRARPQGVPEHSERAEPGTV